ncbi:MAG: radical SAM protein [Rectinema subterraneum]|jgi:pyruvate formate lyase activating enzyme
MTIFDIQRFSVEDGPGIRTTIFLKGCPLRCKWCQNPEGLEFGLGSAYAPRVGEGIREIEPETLAEEAMADKVFFETSGGGVTFSGGEPLAQVDALVRTARLLHANGIHTAVETSLFVSREAIEKALGVIDLFLADLKILDPDLHERATGKRNKVILENFRFLAQQTKGSGRLIVRTPLVPGYTAIQENLEAIGAFIASIDPGIPWEMLNFNPLASAKYMKLGKSDYEFMKTRQFPEKEMAAFRSIAAKYGLNNGNSKSES